MFQRGQVGEDTESGVLGADGVHEEVGTCCRGLECWGCGEGS